MQHNPAINSEKRLSVIIPTYNRVRHVLECIASVNSAGLTDTEIIVADDGSTDDTGSTLARIEPSVKYIWQANTGTPSTARNAGFAQSRGKYVAFLDCDDAWLQSVPCNALQLLDRYPEVDVLFADARMGNPEQGYTSWIDIAGQSAFFNLPHRQVEPDFRILEQRSLFRRMSERNPVFIGSVIMRREIFAESGGFNPNLRGAADWELWLRLASRYTFGFLSAPMAIYSRHTDNMSSNHDHMIGEFCQTLANIEHLPSIHPDDRSWVTSRHQQQLYNHAYIAYDSGNYSAARTRFGLALSAGNRTRSTRILYATCHLPNGIIRNLRRIKQAIALT